MNNLIDGFGFSTFRSFGDEIQVFSPCSKINLIIGQNNSGKSNVLLFLANYYNQLINSIGVGDSFVFTDLDKNKGLIGNKLKVTFGFQLTDTDIKNIRDTLLKKSRTNDYHFEKLFGCVEFLNETNFVWFPYSADLGSIFHVDEDFVNTLVEKVGFSPNEWRAFLGTFDSYASGGLKDTWIPRIIDSLAKMVIKKKEIELIPAFRSVRNRNEDGSEDNGGAGIIENLAQLQNPDIQHLSKKDDFERINKFLQEVTDNPSARLEIPHNREYILVQMDGKTLPLTSLGTGIHELVILAAQATIRKNCVICIEEPELHMHPILQKRLLKYLQENTENQYFISTHSAHILDTPKASIFHVTLENGSSRVKVVNNNNEKFTVCNDLGYKASDLLQTNCIVWVEGPSDRIYINHWIKFIKPELVEGLHYSIMFYGGRLLSHLSADDIEVNDFIALRKLNMNLAIVIDSDKSEKNKPINATKKRIKSEFDQGPGFAWITLGQEIENYIDSSLLTTSIRSIHPNAILPSIIDHYSDCLKLTNKQGDPLPPDKIKIAHKVIESPANLDVLDLQKQMKKLIEFIEKANS